MKKKVLLALCAAILVGTLNAQTTPPSAIPASGWDSTFRPGNYAQQVETFRAYPHHAKDIVFLGNSITAGVNWNELLENGNAHNRGISGDITFGVLERLDEVISGQPAKVFILIGINDISRNIPDSVIIANHRKMVQRIKAGSPKTKIYFQTLLPVNNTFTQFKSHYNKDEHIKAVNDALWKLGKDEGITIIDLNKPFQDAEGKLMKDITRDGLHLKYNGYQIWAKILKAYL